MGFPFGSWRSFLASIESNKRRDRCHSSGPKLGLEHLEDRRLLAVTSVSVSGQDLVIRGSDTAESVVVAESSPNVLSVRYTLNGSVVTDTFNKAQVQSIVFFGNGGDDRFENRTDVASTGYGAAGNDVLVGGSGTDTFYGADGDDVLVGGAGNDFLRGEAGNDQILGYDGDDQMFGDAGNDTIYAGAGNDSAVGGDGDDSMYGEAGNDLLSGDAGADFIMGGFGDDNIIGGVGDDRLYGEVGKDRLYGGVNNDLLDGGNGDDLLYGEDGDDLIRGGTGDDSAFGDAGNDSIFGDADNDFLVGGDGNDLLQGGLGDDNLNGAIGDDIVFGEAGIDYLLGGTGNDWLDGGDGDDTMYGDDGDDTLSGGGGNDSLLGGIGHDSLYGDDGNDFLAGDLGDDLLRGSRGNDRLTGNDGDDRLFGDAGFDTLNGSAGNDYLEGGTESDLIRGEAGNDVLRGGSGDDSLLGGAGNDAMSGEAGNDYLVGDVGNDHLSGGLDHDELVGNDGDDWLFGNAGNDLLLGHEGIDRLFGGDGDDELFGGAQADLLAAEAGADKLYGEGGPDVLVGGQAVDALDGGSGEDLLIGGDVTHTQPALNTLLATWNNGGPHFMRVAAIEDHHFTAHLESQETVFDDYVRDSVFGGADRDWFFLPGILPIHDPIGSSEEDRHDEEPAGGHQHPATIVYELPPVEGFDLIDSLDSLSDREANEKLSTLIPHAEDPVLQREHLALFELVRYDQVTHTAVASGNWTDSSTWTNGVVPSAGARVLIPVGVEVTVNGIIPTRHFSIRVDGKLSFATDAFTLLRVDTIVVSTVGTLEMGTAAQPVARNVSARLMISGTTPIDRTYDPFGISRGLITHGSVSMYGAEITSHVEVLNALAAGTTVLQLSQVPVEWRVGDQIVIAGTTSGQVQDEQRQILSIVGNTVTIQPLTSSHRTPSADLKVHVANITRNVIVESEFVDLALRGHVMFMHNRAVSIHNAGFYKLGRTNKFEAVNDPVVDQNWQLVAGTGLNPRARYPVHFHRNDTTIDGNPSIVDSSVVSDSPGWGFVNHSSYVGITDSVTYNVKGAGFVTEVGDETGSFARNIALSTFSSGEAPNSREAMQDFGHSGDGFWFQGAGISVVDNVSAGAEGSAFIFYTLGLVEGNKPKAHYESANLPDPTIARGAPTILVDHVPVREFHGNVGYASNTGLTFRYNLRDATHSAQSILANSTFWNNDIGVHVPYSQNTVLRNLRIIHDATTELGSIGVNTNGVTKNLFLDNITVLGYYLGVYTARRGVTVVNGGTYSVAFGILVQTGAEENRQVIVQGPISFLTPPHGAPHSGVNEVAMVYANLPLGHTNNLDHVFFHNSVILNYGPHQNRKLYFLQQAAGAIPFPEPLPTVPFNRVGLTTLQLSLLGLTIGGELAPANAVSAPRIIGLLAP